MGIHGQLSCNDAQMRSRAVTTLISTGLPKGAKRLTKLHILLMTQQSCVQCAVGELIFDITAAAGSG